ncbi:MAG: hypothetical protein PHI70_07465 [Proteiniphilum sp.]|nr:hypothetical protein [Proteiniphilum sp.]
MKKEGTKITYKSIGKNPDGDNRINLKNTPKIKSKRELKELLKDDEIKFIYVSDFESYAVNKLLFNKKHFLLIEPNPVTFYFSIAFDLVSQFENAKAHLKELLKLTEPNDTSLAIIYSAIFRLGSIGVVFSFLSIEAFMNQKLPDYQKINFKNKKVTKDEIQRWASFDEKLTNIIPQVTNKDFCKKYSKQGILLKDYKKTRDELIHLKQKKTDGLASYSKIYQDILNLDLNKLVQIIKTYINYYKPDTIINFERNEKLQDRNQS